MYATTQHIHWQFTWNSPDEETAAKWSSATGEAPEALFDAGKMAYLVYQVEKAPETGKIHIQGNDVINHFIYAITRVLVSDHEDSVQESQGDAW